MTKNYIVGVDKGHPEGSRTVYTVGIAMNKRFKVVACGLNLPDKENKRFKTALKHLQELFVGKGIMVQGEKNDRKNFV